MGASRSTEHSEGSRHYSDIVRVGSQTEARAAVAESRNRIAIIDRDGPRSVLFQCPCGCTDVVVLNVDGRVGKAWRLRENQRGVTLMPSVWRASGCRSHFVVWESRVWWCRLDDEDDGDERPPGMDRELRAEWVRIRARGRRSR